VVFVPTVEQKENRALIRYHLQIMEDRSRFELSPNSAEI
jgi:hypothetical protein